MIGLTPSLPFDRSLDPFPTPSQLNNLNIDKHSLTFISVKDDDFSGAERRRRWIQFLIMFLDLTDVIDGLNSVRRPPAAAVGRSGFRSQCCMLGAVSAVCTLQCSICSEVMLISDNLIVTIVSIDNYHNVLTFLASLEFYTLSIIKY